TDPDKLAAALLKRFGYQAIAKKVTRGKGARERVAHGVAQIDVPGSASEDGEATNGDVSTLNPRETAIRAVRAFVRKELTDLEQFVMIQIFDQSWKDHLYAMDMLRNGIGLQAFAEKDPRIQYKKEGYKYFAEMMEGIRDKVTDLIFRARIVGNVQARNAY